MKPQIQPIPLPEYPLPLQPSQSSVPEEPASVFASASVSVSVSPASTAIFQKQVGPVVLDWSDRFHPCVLMAVRRSVRSLTFVLVFMGLLLCTFCSLLDDSLLQSVAANLRFPYFSSFWRIREILQAEGAVFWLCITPVFLLVLPVPGLFALCHDIRTRNVETMQMTRLTPFGIVSGLWMSKTLEAMLLGSTLLPYVVLRYFKYGINPALDTAFLVGLVVLSSCISAITISLSAIGNLAVRLIAALCVWGCIMSLIWIVIGDFSAGAPLGANLLVLFSSSILGAIYAMGYAAMSIAPATYNGVHIYRLPPLAMSIVWWALFLRFNSLPDNLLVMQMMVGLPMFVPLLLEDVMHPGGLRPAALRIATGAEDLSAKLWLPGWQAGVWWVMATLVLWGMPLLTSNIGPNRWRYFSIFFLAPGAIFFPFVLIRGLAMFLSIRRGDPSEAWRVLAVNPVSGFVYVFAIIVASYIFSQAFNVLFAASEFSTNAAAEVFFLNPTMQMLSIWEQGGRISVLDGYDAELFIQCAPVWPTFIIFIMAYWEYHYKVRAVNAALEKKMK